MVFCSISWLCQPRLRSLNLCPVSYRVQNKTLKPLIFRPLCQNFFGDVRFSSDRVSTSSQPRRKAPIFSMFSKFSFGRFLLAFGMTKLISAILITLQPFGVKFEALPQVYITLNLPIWICADNIISM